MPNFRESTTWKTAKRIIADPVRRVAAKIVHHGHLPLAWCPGRNWGDALSPVLVSLLSGKTVVHQEGLHQHRYLAIGSILGCANEHAEVWGSGFIRDKERILGHPRAVYAVRGPLSRAGLLEQGIECPEVYGDPALLLPRFYNPDVIKRYEVGLIPHYADKDHPWLEFCRHDPKVRIIDIEGGIHNFVREVKACELIISSSLHGIICADAYGVPALWMELSDNVMGNGFKFFDYFASIQRPVAAPIMPHNLSLAQVVAHYQPYQVRINLDPLWLACPFLGEKYRHTGSNDNDHQVRL